MKRLPPAAIAFSLALAPALGVGLEPSLISAATIVVPPVTVTQLEFGFISIPGPGYTTGVFGATISTGDVVKVRIQAAPGKMFVVHNPTPPSLGGAPGVFYVSVYWNSANGQSSAEEPNTVTFDNLHGPAPTETYSFTTLGDDRQIVQVQKWYEFTVGFTFTAVNIDITATRPHAPVPRQYIFFGSSQIPSFGARDMEMLDIYTPARGRSPGRRPLPTDLLPARTAEGRATSWGRIKALYR